MSIASSLEYLKTAKVDIAAAIMARGGTVNLGDGLADYATDILSIAPVSNSEPQTAKEYIRRSRPLSWPDYTKVDLTGQEVCYLTYAYCEMTEGMERVCALRVVCTGNYTLERGHIGESGFVSEAAFIAAGNTTIGFAGSDTGTTDYVCYRITGVGITQISQSDYTTIDGEIHFGTQQPVTEVYARLPNLSSSPKYMIGLYTRFQTLIDVSGIQTLKNGWSYSYNIEALVLDGWDTTQLTSLENTWNACYALKFIDGIESWDTSQVTNLYQTWYWCYNYQSDLDLTGWVVSNVGTIKHTWDSCRNIKKLDLSGWDLSNVSQATYLWSGCYRLVELNVSGWVTINFTSIDRMWQECMSLKQLDVSDWDTPRLSISAAWNGDYSLTYLDVSGLNMAGVGSLAPTVFQNCINLQTFIPFRNVRKSFYLSNSPGLSKASLIATLDALSDLTGLTSQTLTLGAQNNAKLTPEEIAIATAKNWTIA